MLSEMIKEYPVFLLEPHGRVNGDIFIYTGPLPVDTDRIPRIDGQGCPDEAEGDRLHPGKGFAKHGNSQQQHAGGRSVLDEAQGGQGDPFGPEVEKQQRRGRQHSCAQ